MTYNNKDESKKTKIIVKAPTQERSRQTVATILEACSRLLVSEGFYVITTDKIAKEAGVSIGSLYQFFGNKESVVQAVVKNIIEQDKQVITDKMKAVTSTQPEERIKSLIQIALDTVRGQSDLRAKLMTIQYYVSDAAYISEMIQFYQHIVKQNLPTLTGRNPDAVAYLIVNGFIGLTNTMAIDNPKAVHDEKITQEILRMFHSFLGLDNAGQNEDRTNKGDFT